MPAAAQPRPCVEAVFTNLHKTCDVSGCQAAGMLVHAAEATGGNAGTLLGMLDQGTAVQKVLELVVSKDGLSHYGT